MCWQWPVILITTLTSSPREYRRKIGNRFRAPIREIIWAPTPLYNIATKSAIQPGSIFKPVTAVAALKCGLDPDMQIYDGRYIQVGGRKWGCSVYNSYGGSHGSQTMITGIQNSCNYYFYCVATGINWNTGASLGYDEEITIEKIMEVQRIRPRRTYGYRAG